MQLCHSAGVNELKGRPTNNRVCTAAELGTHTALTPGDSPVVQHHGLPYAQPLGAAQLPEVIVKDDDRQLRARGCGRRKHQLQHLPDPIQPLANPEHMQVAVGCQESGGEPVQRAVFPSEHQRTVPALRDVLAFQCT